MMAWSSRPTKEAEGESTNDPNWLELPRDLTSNILQKLDDVEIVTSASQVCSLWWNICKDPLMWRTIDMMTYLPFSCYELEKICRAAVERSCGHLEDISIEDFCRADLLKYIADSTSHLRCLRLPRCWDISDRVMCEVVMKLPLLEELDISFTGLTNKDSLETIGMCCPHLKALKFNKMASHRWWPDSKVNEEAFVISIFMPELRHLEITGNILDNDGLLAILDGCPLLEYLELGNCFNVDLSGSLGKRCREQIKDLKLPNDFKYKVSDDYPSSDTDFDDHGPADWGLSNYYPSHIDFDHHVYHPADWGYDGYVSDDCF